MQKSILFEIHKLYGFFTSNLKDINWLVFLCEITQSHLSINFLRMKYDYDYRENIFLLQILYLYFVFTSHSVPR